MSERELLNSINSALIDVQNEYVHAKEKLLTAKSELADAEAQLNLKDKNAWKNLGITNQAGRDAYIRKQTNGLHEKIHEAKIKLDYIEVQVNFQKNKLAIYLATTE